MSTLSRVAAGAAAIVLLATPVMAQSIQGAGSGSTGGTIDGKSNENSTMTRTGADNGGEAVGTATPQAGAGTGDNAILNAPGEKKPGSTGTNQPSSMNGSEQ